MSDVERPIENFPCGSRGLTKTSRSRAEDKGKGEALPTTHRQQEKGKTSQTVAKTERQASQTPNYMSYPTEKAQSCLVRVRAVMEMAKHGEVKR